MTIKGKTDWRKVRDLTEEEIEKSAASDPDAPLLTEKELSEFKRVNPKQLGRLDEPDCMKD